MDLQSAEAGFLAWLEAGFAGRMAYMEAHGLKRLRPAELVPGTVRVITARMDYLPRSVGDAQPEADWVDREWSRLAQPGQAVISMYARGRDYHRVLRSRLARLGEFLQQRVGPLGHRAFTDSAPVAEVELAQRSGLGWRGKHTLLLHRSGGSMFFLGELFVDLPLPVTPPVTSHCGSCQRCLDLCPTGAIVAPYQLDARRCISYLTIEEPEAIAPALRPLIGNRLYGCDDCQLACPWNRHARRSTLADFDERGHAREPDPLVLWRWSEADFLARTEGTAIRRIGWRRWRRNLAVVVGNALRAQADPDWCRRALDLLGAARLQEQDPMVLEHIEWALAQAQGQA